jgi:hypothetical protein
MMYPASFPFAVDFEYVQNFNFEVSTPFIGPSIPSTTIPPLSSPSSPVAVVVEGAAASLGLTPNEAHNNLYLALIFDTSAVKSISAASGLFVVGKVLIKSIRILA